MNHRPLLALAFLLIAVSSLPAQIAQDGIAHHLRQLDTNVFPAAERDAARAIVPNDLRAKIRASNAANSAAWARIDSREAWETFKNERIAALRASLGLPPSLLPVGEGGRGTRPDEGLPTAGEATNKNAVDPHPSPLPQGEGVKRPKATLHVTREIPGDGFVIKNVLYGPDHGLSTFVSANLYLPAKIPASMPGILLSHSHHSPKWQGELQDMGMTWARAGCAVLVPDHLGHGERRQHPFATASDYDKEFAVGRQDYYFRYDTGMQLHLVGSSLMGQLVRDLMAGVDVLLMQERIDPKRIVLLGGVAGGGDPAAVAGALDERITCVGPYNFGGPQPETRYPLPDDAETSFNYAGGGSWESTRNLTGSAAGLGFQPWVIVGSIAPRKLIYGHEFAWDGERDPVFKRLKKIWGFYGDEGGVAVAHGKGNLQGQEPESSHCGNIGVFHRRMIHPLFNKWLGIDSSTDTEYSKRRTAQELTCWNDEWREKLKPKMLYEVLRERANAHLATLQKVDAKERFAAWKKLLQLEPVAAPKVDLETAEQPANLATHVASVVRLRLDGRIPLVLLLPKGGEGRKVGIALVVSQAGKNHFLREHAKDVAELLRPSIAVALVDVRGTGETTLGDDRGQYSAATSYSSSALMTGRPLICDQLHDLQTAIAYLRTRSDIDNKRIGLWGASLAKPLAADAQFKFPRRIERPSESSPLGALLVMLAAAFDPEVRAVGAQGGIVTMGSILDRPFVQTPHDFILPDALAVGDLPSLCTDYGKDRSIMLTEFVDGLNRRIPAEEAAKKYSDTKALVMDVPLWKYFLTFLGEETD